MKRLLLVVALAVSGCATAPAALEGVGSVMLTAGGILNTAGKIATGVGGALVKDTGEVITTPISLAFPSTAETKAAPESAAAAPETPK